jgi:hypothetical protein
MSLSNLTNNQFGLSVDGLSQLDTDILIVDGIPITGLYLNSESPTTNVNSVITLASGGQFEIQDHLGQVLINITDSPPLVNVAVINAIALITENIVANPLLNIFISNNTLTNYVRVVDADGVDLTRIGYNAFGLPVNYPLNHNYMPVVSSAQIFGSLRPFTAPTITTPNWDHFRLFNILDQTNFTSLICDGVGTSIITCPSAGNALIDAPDYRIPNFYLTPTTTHIAPNSQNVLINEINGVNDRVYIGFDGTGATLNSTLVQVKNGFNTDKITVDENHNLSYISNNITNPLIAEIFTNNEYSNYNTRFNYYCGSNYAVKWSNSYLPFSNMRLMNGNNLATTTVNNSFLDIKVDGTNTLFYFSPTAIDYFVDAPSLEVIRINNTGLVTIPNLSVTGITISPPLTLASPSVSTLLILSGTGSLGSQSALQQFKLGSSGRFADIGLNTVENFRINCPYQFQLNTGTATSSILGLSQTVLGLVKCDAGLTSSNLTVSGASVQTGITNTGNIQTTTLNVTGASTQTGITNTGNIQTTTLNVTGASTQTGITNTGLLTNNGNFICNIPALDTANFNTGKLQVGNNTASITDGFTIMNGFLQCNNTSGMEVTNGNALFQQKVRIDNLLTINGGAQGTMVYTKLAMNLVLGGFTTLTAANISNAYIFSNTNASGVQMNLQLPSGTDLATTYGNNSIIEFYISQCGILTIPAGPPFSGFNGIVVYTGNPGIDWVTTDLTVTGVVPTATGAFVPTLWNTATPSPLATATYKCIVNIQNGIAWFNFKYNGHPFPLAGWA